MMCELSRPVRVLIFDADASFRGRLRTLVSRLPSVCVVGEAGTMAAAVTALARNDYDAVFLDVQWDNGCGFDLMPLVKSDAAVIFITAHDDQAVRAFEVNAADYILKPITAARLAESLGRLERGFKARAVRGEAAGKSTSNDRIFLRGASAGGRFVSVAKIVAIISSENYSEVLLEDGERWLVRKTMATWEKLLPPNIFMRVRRTAIINVHRIERIDRDDAEHTTLRLESVRESFRVGRRVWPQLQALLERHQAI